MREHLKKQIEDKGVALKLQSADGAKETEFLCEVDRQALSSEREQRIQHRQAMTAYRDENKRVHSYTTHHSSFVKGHVQKIYNVCYDSVFNILVAFRIVQHK